MSNIYELQTIFISNLKLHRKAKNISQEKLAELIDMSAGTIGDIESGKSAPSLKTIQKIINALNLKPYDLFLTGESNEPYNKEKLQEILLNDVEKILSNRL